MVCRFSKSSVQAVEILVRWHNRPKRRFPFRLYHDQKWWRFLSFCDRNSTSETLARSLVKSFCILRDFIASLYFFYHLSLRQKWSHLDIIFYCFSLSPNQPTTIWRKVSRCSYILRRAENYIDWYDCHRKSNRTSRNWWIEDYNCTMGEDKWETLGTIFWLRALWRGVTFFVEVVGDFPEGLCWISSRILAEWFRRYRWTFHNLPC